MSALRVHRARKLFEGRRAIAAVALLTCVFLALGILVRYSVLQGFDLRVTQELQERSLPTVVSLMRAATWAGSPAVVPFVGVAAALLVWRAGLPRAAALVLLSLLAVPLNVLLKEFWDRARPDAAIVHVAVKTAGASFPSGHAMAGTALYGALAALAWIHVEDRRHRLIATLTAGLLPAIVDASRVYLGAHWLSDVIGGSAIGLVLLLLLVRWYLAGIPQESAHQEEAKEDAEALLGT